MVHPARLELTIFYSGARKTPLRAIGLSSIEQSETSKNTVYWLQYWHKPIPLKNGIPVDVLSHPEPTNNIPHDNCFFKFLKNKKPSEEG